ncbi:MAG: SDR family oxidoreductase [Acidobacteriota bacterium]
MKDQVIVITGASTGIGEALAYEVARRGGKVVLAARRQAELDRVAGTIGEAALAVTTDVTRRADHERLRDRAIERFGHIDVWINNAGRALWRPVSELTDDDIDEMVTVNVKSVVYGIQAVLPHFRDRQRGHLITISSGLSRFPLVAQRSAYSAAKAAVNLLMASLRVELRDQLPGVHTTIVLPGVVATDFGLNALHGGVDNRKLPNAQPADEVARVIADTIERPRAEVYTRPQLKELAARYFAADDLDAIETQPPFFPYRR